MQDQQGDIVNMFEMHPMAHVFILTQMVQRTGMMQRITSESFAVVVEDPCLEIVAGLLFMGIRRVFVHVGDRKLSVNRTFISDSGVDRSRGRLIARIRDAAKANKFATAPFTPNLPPKPALEEEEDVGPLKFAISQSPVKPKPKPKAMVGRLLHRTFD